ncbi:hypothetical protein I5Q34_24280 [Streptomyces sp. AV19]|uniref:asparagine synthase-related protein n=1 Tax=Streptomyces sp. AV19 TaxID=2793068 RepID=UPI0018FE2D1C|nr:asparagine synthase C-terminal domain-containing protein [Streptomyces sp. AV19]MBH1937348.1 hypothetical protein [Streptomyces sp. AV19]MDG4533922.1 asparagine synthase C-terminal domain-containing protein [Streptomyces sp. AV19]
MRGEDPPEARVRELLHLSLTRWLALMPDFKDRMSMRTGLEVRVPFCDHRLVACPWNVPWRFKAPGGLVKGLLCDAMAGAVPEEVLRRRKTSFPVDAHPGYESALREELRAEPADPGSPLAPLVDRRALESLLRRGAPPRGVWRTADTFATLLQIAAWLRVYRVGLL